MLPRLLILPAALKPPGSAMITKNTWKRGFADGLKTAFALLRVVLPVFAVIKVLEHTPVIGWLSTVFDPLMWVVGLPGEAALAVVTGMLLNFYASLGIILALGLNAWQITIMAVMLSCCHELVLESAIIKKTGIAAWPVLAIRLVTAFGAAAVMNLVGNILS
jgi:spore maturation protein SpmB